MMCSRETPQKNCPSKIVKLNNALNLAEKWVNNMSQASGDEPTEVEGRPSRLGLGAKVCRQSKIGPLNSPLEKKLYAKLSARSKSAEKSSTAMKDGCDDDDDDDNEDEDSRTSVFNKKRAANPLTPILRENKKKKDWDSFLLSMEWILVDKLNNTYIAFWQLKLDVSILGNEKIVELKNLVREIGRYVDFSREQEKRRRSWRHANYR